MRPAKLVFVVPTPDLAANIRFYRDGLGLELAEEWSEMGRGAILRGSTGSEVELVEVDEVADPPEPRTALGLQVSEGEVDSIFRREALSRPRADHPRPKGIALGCRSTVRPILDARLARQPGSTSTKATGWR